MHKTPDVLKSLEDITKRVEYQESIHTKDMTFHPAMMVAIVKRNIVTISLITLISTTATILVIKKLEND